jgi:hypothetical protein
MPGNGKHAGIAAAVMSLVQVGLPMIGIQENFVLGVLVWVAIVLLSIYAIWAFNFPSRYAGFVKTVLSILVVAIIVAGIWSPIDRLYRKEHPVLKLQAKSDQAVTQGDLVGNVLVCLGEPLYRLYQHPPAYFERLDTALYVDITNQTGPLFMSEIIRYLRFSMVNNGSFFITFWDWVTIPQSLHLSIRSVLT